MMAWLAANWLTVVCIAAVAGLIALCLVNILPRKGKSAPPCAGCPGNCAGCAGCPAKK